jgi:glutathione S-transferase
MVPGPLLIIGNRNYSSWSLRPWLAMRWAGISFDERRTTLGGPGYGRSKIAEVREVSASGKLPVLQVDGESIWDSLAISEWAAAHGTRAALYPITASEYAVRSAVCEMHGGFAALRRDLSMNIRRRVQIASWSSDTRDDIERIFELWTACLQKHRGAWLFGERSLADAFYLPVATRFRTYGVALPAHLAKYVELLLSDADFREWETAASEEVERIDQTDALYATGDER